MFTAGKDRGIKPNLPLSIVHALLDLDGWATLGVADEALNAFQRLPDEIRDDPEVLSQFTAFLWRVGCIKECFDYAVRAIALYPAQVLFWVIASSCLKGPEVREARRVLLLKAAESCPNESARLRAIAEEEI